MVGCFIQQVLHLLRKVSFFHFWLFFLRFQGTRCWDKRQALTIDLLACLLPSVCLALQSVDGKPDERAMGLERFPSSQVVCLTAEPVESRLARPHRSLRCGEEHSGERWLSFSIQPWTFLPLQTKVLQGHSPALSTGSASTLGSLLGSPRWKNSKGTG